MSEANWERKQFQPEGGNAFLFYAVFGDLPDEITISGKEYHCASIPDGVELLRYDAENQPDVLDGFREGPMWDLLVQENPAMAAQVERANCCALVRGEISDPPNLRYLRDCVGLVTWFLDHGGCCVYDPEMLRWWEPGVWRQQIFEPHAPVPRHHVVILCSGEETGFGLWLHTRGMRKFGRPDLSVHNVPQKLGEAVIDLLNRLIETQAFGAVIPEGQEIRMASLPAGMQCHHRGYLDDPDFNNVHVEICWPSE